MYKRLLHSFIIVGDQIHNFLHIYMFVVLKIFNLFIFKEFIYIYIYIYTVTWSKHIHSTGSLFFALVKTGQLGT